MGDLNWQLISLAVSFIEFFLHIMTTYFQGHQSALFSLISRYQTRVYLFVSLFFQKNQTSCSSFPQATNWNFFNYFGCLPVEFSLTYLGTLTYDCVINAREIFSFLPLINNSVAIGLNILLLIISPITSSKMLFLYCIHQYF